MTDKPPSRTDPSNPMRRAIRRGHTLTGRRVERNWKPAKDHPWRKFGLANTERDRKRGRDIGVHWETGDKLPDTLDHWVKSAVKGNRGLVLNRELARRLAERLGLVAGGGAASNGSAHPTHRKVADDDVAERPQLVDADLAALQPSDRLLLRGLSVSDDEPDESAEGE